MQIMPTLTTIPDFFSDHRTGKKLYGYEFLSAPEYAAIYEVTLGMCALSLSLNLCCLLVCAIQFLLAVKLVKSSPTHGKTR